MTTNIQPLTSNNDQVKAAVVTICDSFSDDPLIRWLRPGGVPWATLEPDIIKWQSRRLRWAQGMGNVVRAVFSGNQAGQTAAGTEDGQYAGIEILNPPHEKKAGWYTVESIRRISTLLSIVFENVAFPAPDNGGSLKRINIMMQTHDRVLKHTAASLPKTPLWYLEVCCVRSSMQGRGIGKALMNWTLEQIGNDACLLECTSEANVAFYKKFGFDVIEEVELDEAAERVKLWFMLRNGGTK